MTQNYRFAENSALYMLKISGSLKPAFFIAIFYGQLKSLLFPVKNLMSATIFVLDCTLINTASSFSLRFYCVRGCWDGTQDFDIGNHSQRL
jgi:hypothetical protein